MFAKARIDLEVILLSKAYKEKCMFLHVETKETCYPIELKKPNCVYQNFRKEIRRDRLGKVECWILNPVIATTLARKTQQILAFNCTGG